MTVVAGGFLEVFGGAESGEVAAGVGEGNEFVFREGVSSEWPLDKA